MGKLGTQKDYWNSRATVKGNYGPPLNLSSDEIEFQQKHLVQGGKTLVLGATTALCEIARNASSKVVSVDFAEDIIKALRLDGVDYKCMDWDQFFQQSTEQFDNIMTDGGMVCLEYYEKWRQMIQHITEHLSPNGIFTAKFYLSRATPPKNKSKNPSVERFMTLKTSKDNNWMVAPTHPGYKDYNVRYALPPEPVVLKAFDQLTLHDKLIPNYEDGEHFTSYAWRR